MQGKLQILRIFDYSRHFLEAYPLNVHSEFRRSLVKFCLGVLLSPKTIGTRLGVRGVLIQRRTPEAKYQQDQNFISSGRYQSDESFPLE